MAKISVDINNVISKIDDRLYGSFIEHLGAQSTKAYISRITGPPMRTDSVRTFSNS